MSTRVGTETWAMNERQAAAILALQEQYPAPMVVGWRTTGGTRVQGHVFRTVDHDERGVSCGEFSICTTGVVRWYTEKP